MFSSSLRVWIGVFFFIGISFLITTPSCGKWKRKPSKKAQKTKQKEEMITEKNWRSRDSLNEYNRYFDVRHYALQLSIQPKGKQISGRVRIRYKVLRSFELMQFDLQSPLQIDSITQSGNSLTFSRIQDKIFVQLKNKSTTGAEQNIEFYYHGVPRPSHNPPWNSGFVWQKDSLGRNFIGIASQHLGGSIWFPCKDYLGDKAEEGVDLSLEVPSNLVAVGNGVLQAKEEVDSNRTLFKWSYNQAISTYNITFYAGHFVHWQETYAGQRGPLPLSYWVLDYNKEKAVRHFAQVLDILEAFEYWMGPYPFYGMPLQVVEAPFVGMEYQGAIAYGNGYENGYRNKDLSGTGFGKYWDFILVHEIAHQWFGNKVSAISARDEWIQESFTDYAESLFTEYHYGKKAALAYTKGKRKLIKNETPILTDSLQYKPDTDMYFKGGNMLQTLRTYLHNDAQFRALLHGLTQSIAAPVSSATFITWIEQFLKKDLHTFFHYYLRTKKPPILQYKIVPSESKILFRYARVEKDFTLPFYVGTQLVQAQKGRWVSVSLGEASFLLYPRYVAWIDEHYYFQMMPIAAEENTEE